MRLKPIPLIILAVIIIVGFTALRGAGLLSVFGTYQITSIDAVNIITNPSGQNLPTGEYWLINLNTLGVGGYDQLYGEKTEGQLTYENWKNGKGIRLDMEITKPISCDYQLAQYQGVGTNLAWLQTYKRNFGSILIQTERTAAATSWCSNEVGGQYLIPVNLQALGYVDYICIKEEIRGVKGQQMSSTGVSWEEKFTLKNSDQTIATSTISQSAGSHELKLVNGQVIGKTTWTGNLLGSSLACDYSLNSFTPIFQTSTNTWSISNADKVGQYFSTYDVWLSQYPSYIGNENAIYNQVNLINTRLQEALARTQNSPFVYTTINGNTASVEATGNPLFPQISLYISTSFMPKVAIIQEGGQPDITQTPNVEFTTGGSATGTGSVKNVGSGTGRFALTASCPYTVSIVPQTTDALYMQGTSAFYYTVSGVCSSQETKACTITARDVNTQLTDTSTFQATCNPLCTKQCGMNTIRNDATCECVCQLTQPYHWNLDYTACSKECMSPPIPCQYGQDPVTCLCKPPGDCTLTCGAKYTPNAACNACVCALDPQGAPNGYVLDPAKCDYILKGGGLDLNALLLGGFGLLLAIIIIAVIARRKR